MSEVVLKIYVVSRNQWVKFRLSGNISKIWKNLTSSHHSGLNSLLSAQCLSCSQQRIYWRTNTLVLAFNAMRWEWKNDRIRSEWCFKFPLNVGDLETMILWDLGDLLTFPVAPASGQRAHFCTTSMKMRRAGCHAAAKHRATAEPRYVTQTQTQSACCWTRCSLTCSEIGRSQRHSCLGRIHRNCFIRSRTVLENNQEHLLTYSIKHSSEAQTSPEGFHFMLLVTLYMNLYLELIISQ